jgi:cellulose synthase/poly-beta-1,6-N-acetylglucosamine synthase-like glycosyltransferase
MKVIPPDLHEVSRFAMFTILVCLAPMLMAVVYAVRPTERRLALMRPLSLAAIFAAVAGAVSGIATVLRGIAATGQFTATAWEGLSEALVPVFVGFAFLTVAWLLVTLGMRRTG